MRNLICPRCGGQMVPASTPNTDKCEECKYRETRD